MSSIRLRSNSLAFNPFEDVRFAEAPVLAEPQAMDSFDTALARALVNPRD